MSTKTLQNISSETYADLQDLCFSLVEFCKETNPYLYFYLERASVGTNIDGDIQVNYDASDADGNEISISVTVADGKIVCSPDRYFNFGNSADGQKCRGLISGVDGKGLPIHSSVANPDAQYYSALNLLITDISRISSRTGVSVSRVTFPANSRNLSLVNVTADARNEGDYKLEFKDTNENMADLEAFVAELKRNADEKGYTAANTLNIPLDTSVAVLDGDFALLDLDSGDLYETAAMVVKSAVYNDTDDHDEMLELAANEGNDLVVDGSKGSSIDPHSDLVIDLDRGRVIGTNLAIIRNNASLNDKKSLIEYGKTNGVKLIAAG